MAIVAGTALKPANADAARYRAAADDSRRAVSADLKEVHS
jgi:hypothetical protein